MFCSSWCDASSKKLPIESLVSNWIGMKFGTIVIEINAHQMSETIRGPSHFQDGGHDVISRIKVLPSGEYRRSAAPAPIQ